MTSRPLHEYLADQRSTGGRKAYWPAKPLAGDVALVTGRQGEAAVPGVSAQAQKMTANKVLSAFDQGRRVGSDHESPAGQNPFQEGSAEHNNFEVGRRFGAKHPAPTGRLPAVAQGLSAGESS